MLSFKWHSSKGAEEKARVRQATVTQPAQCKGMTFGFALGNIEHTVPDASTTQHQYCMHAVMLESQTLQTMRHTRGLK